MGTPQIMETDARQGAMAAKKTDPLLPEAVRPQGRSVRLRDHEIVVGEAPAESQ